MQSFRQEYLPHHLQWLEMYMKKLMMQEALLPMRNMMITSIAVVSGGWRLRLLKGFSMSTGSQEMRSTKRLQFPYGDISKSILLIEEMEANGSGL